jgi:ABC-type Mn2+/Zn2+ transport system permease subunit
MIFDSVYWYFILFSVGMGMAIGVISAYMVAKKWSILGDIISHAALPGIVISFFISYSVFLPYLLIGGTCSSLLSVMISFYLQKYEFFPKDTSFSILLSWFFSLGIIIFNIIQQRGIVGQSILNSFIFGNILMINHTDALYYFFYGSLLTLSSWYTLKKQEFFIFDPIFSSLTFRFVLLWELLFLVVSIFTIIVALQSVGILLIGGLIILPGSTALLIAKNYAEVFYYSIFFSIVIFLAGINITFLIPTLPTGPLTILIAACIFFVILLIKNLRYRNIL